jgi:heme export protein D (CcmD)
MIKYFLTLISLFSALFTFAQGETAEASNNFMLSNHKVFVAVAVLALILVIIFAFLFSVERRLKQLEDRQKS